MAVKIRTFADEDLSVLVALINETNRGSYQFFPCDEERLRSWIQKGKLEILMAETNRRVVGSSSYNDGHWGEEIRWLAVPERPDRRSIEAMLVKEAERFAKRGTIFTTVDSDSPKINEWIERGYRIEKGLYHMIARLDSPKPLPSTPECTVIRSMRKEEEAKLVEAVNAGFGTERLKIGDIQQWKTDNPPFDEGWVHMAETDGKIVSVVVSTPDTFYNKSFNAKRGYLGPATTLPEYRGKNLASALTRQAMNFLLERGMDSVALYTSEQNASSVSLVQKLGFKIGHHWKFMRKNLPE